MTSTETAKRGAIYLAAAEAIEARPLLQSCCAVTYCVSSAIPPIDCDEAQAYVSVFTGGGMMEYGRMVREIPYDERQGYRILALCFMAAMVEAGDA